MYKTKFVKQGVYFLFLRGELQYIGKSCNVYYRVGQHLGEFDFDDVWFTSINGDERTLRNVESALIDLYQPPKNKRGISIERSKMSFDDRLKELINGYEKDWEEAAQEQDEDEREIVSGWFWYCPISRPKKADIESITKYIEMNEVRNSLCCVLSLVGKTRTEEFIITIDERFKKEASV